MLSLHGGLRASSIVPLTSYAVSTRANLSLTALNRPSDAPTQIESRCIKVGADLSNGTISEPSPVRRRRGFTTIPSATRTDRAGNPYPPIPGLAHGALYTRRDLLDSPDDRAAEQSYALSPP